ncbi:MAG: nucleoside deaminase [Muribaculaceae bacterium]|nr:nucleoside deaminase [Muribaculaceae bacterium]
MVTAITETDKKFIKMACELASDNIDNGGGPFGAVIVKDGEVVATGCNRVTATNDPTAHAEINAIREACNKLENFKLDDCVIYSSCEPCSMCLSAIYWAGISKVYYANTKLEATAIDFDDNFIYEEIGKRYEHRSIPFIHVVDKNAIDHFEKWASKLDRIKY